MNPKDAIGRTKAPMHLIPPALYEPVARVMELGAKKYGAYNWRTDAVNLTVYLDALKRHWNAVIDGQWIDAESGQPHLAHVAACVAIILDAEAHGKLNHDLVTIPWTPKPDTLRGSVAEKIVADREARAAEARKAAFKARMEHNADPNTRHAMPFDEACRTREIPGVKSNTSLIRKHRSDCALHNGPGYPIGPCDCRLYDAAHTAADTPERMVPRGVSQVLP